MIAHPTRDGEAIPDPQAQAGWLGRFAPALLLLGGFALSTALAYWTVRNIDNEARVMFERRADRLVVEIQRRVNRPGYGLKGARGMYMASDIVKRHEFRAYVESHDLAEFPGTLGLGFIERVPRADLEEHIARERADGAPDYQVHPESDGDPLYIIKHIFPLEPNRPAWGFDVGTEPRRREAVERAIETGSPTMTARLNLVQDNQNRAGFLYLVPVFHRGAPLATPAQRSAALMGLAYAPIVIDNAFANIGEHTENMLRFDVYEGSHAEAGEVLFDFDAHLSEVTGLVAEPGGRGGRYASTHEMSVAGRTWTVEIVSTARFDDSISHLAPALFALGGMFFSVLLASAAWSLGHGRERAYRLATLMTRDLALAKERADAANRSKSEFLANMSHEIRTPLTSILGYTNLLRDEGDLSKAPPERVNAISTIQAAGEHLMTVINDILDLSKIEAGRVVVERIDTPLVQLLVDIQQLMRLRASERGVSLRTVFATPVPDHIISDPTRLRQILMNLVGNAAKFTTEGHIEIRVHVHPGEPEGRIRFEIEDTGPGMTEAQANKLFTPFTQADNSVTRRHGGTGLGLTISRRLAMVMGGDVYLHATEPGRGSCFVLELPLAVAPGATFVDAISNEEGPAAVPLRSPSAKLLALSGKLLVAEDNVVNQRLIAFHLKKAGAEVDVTINGREALEMVLRAENEGRPYAVLLTDMQMPEMDGYTLARTLRDRACDIPIVALTAHAMAEDRQKCIEAGCNDYVTKPIDKAALIEACWRWTRGDDN